MIALMCFYLRLFTLPFKSKIRLEAEDAILGHQLIVLRRTIRRRARFTNGDRLFFIWLYRWFPRILDTLRIIRPETLVRCTTDKRLLPAGAKVAGWACLPLGDRAFPRRTP
jgi:hypothetical protein